jgi:formylglycine-generating enzyme required for sulfatase activity
MDGMEMKRIKHKDHKVHKVFLCVLCVLCVLICSAALAGSVENVRWSVTADDKIIVDYDLVGSGVFTISLSVSTDSGATFHLQPRAISGDVGANIAPSRGKRIVWDVFRDLKRLSGNMAVSVIASAAKQSPPGVLASAAKQSPSPLPGMTFALIPAGAFTMGSPANEEGRDDDESPQHRVTLNSFYIMTTEVTQSQWQAVMGSNPSYFKGDNLPVEQVSWNDVQEFIKKLNQRDPGKGYRLPSEAEWEYSCRAGTTTRFYTGNAEADLARAGWYDGNSGSKTHAVGQKTPNAWDLYDMHGNVWEWCQDWYHDSYNGAPVDGRAWETPSETFRVLRGGSWGINVRICRSSFRFRYEPDNRNDYFFGFRVACSP